MIIAVVNQKGGTGKTTVATNLASCFAMSGPAVLLVDADPQQSALLWQQDRPISLPHVSVMGLPAMNLRREVPHFHEKYPVIILDCGGQDNAPSRAAVMVATFLLVPAEASVIDIRSTQRFFHEVVTEAASLKGNIDGAILCTMVKTGTTFNTESSTQIRELGYPVLDTVLSHRITYQQAFASGMGVVEYDAKSKAADEVRTLFQEIQGATR